jgi:hypothetical protein
MSRAKLRNVPTHRSSIFFSLGPQEDETKLQYFKRTSKSKAIKHCDQAIKASKENACAGKRTYFNYGFKAQKHLKIFNEFTRINRTG